MTLEIKVQNIINNFEDTASDEFLEILEQIMLEFKSNLTVEYLKGKIKKIVELSSEFIPDMKAAGWGRILAIGSSGVIQPIPNLGISNVVRSALVGWTKSLSNDLAGRGITVNMLLPGRIHTKRIDELDQAVAQKTGQTLESVRTASKATIPVGRYGKVEEFADTAAFICSDRAGYITGSLIRCDGGLIKSV